MNNNPKTTFWNFLKNNTIEIPIIQRDYAQGRKGKEELRKTFLASLKNALDKKQELTLDFVYGSTSENNRLNPLDGQQRLTTLWLLHWYVAYKANALTDDIIATFKNFTYETRVSSREFCEKLAEFSISNNSSKTISDFIQQQTWFYSAWKQDPTIQSMLRMLSGTPNKDKNGQEIVDGLEELFANFTKTFEDYWTLLSGNKCPINFYSLNLGELKLTDDLYIKMNARGEQLTSFENFKADLVGYIKGQQKEAENSDKEQWGKFLDPKEGIPIKMDTTWTDIFWKNQKNGKIDDIYFAFLNRFFLNEFICKKNSDNSNYDKTVIKDIENDPTFKLLNGDDSNIVYQGFEKYKAYITEISLNSLQETLDNFVKFVGDKELYELNKLFQPNWSKDIIIFDFIPTYKDALSITTLTQPQRVVFYAICKYFELGAYDETSLKRWMRVVWNLVENDSAGWIGCLRLIDELSKNSHDIYKFLAEEKSIIESKANNEQIKEEREKAKQILYSQEGTMLPEKPESLANSSNPWDWEQAIITAEQYAFFKGSIRFLIRNEKGEYGWDDFDTKWKNAQKYFDKKGVTEIYKVPITKALIIQCSKWNDQLYDKQIFNPEAKTWNWILTSRNWLEPVHYILAKGKLDLVDSTKEIIDDTNANNFIKPILDKLPIEYIQKNVPEARFKWNGKLGLYKPKTWDAIAIDWGAWKRNKILSDPAYYEEVEEGKTLNAGKITSNQKIDGCDFFWGWNIDFTYAKENKEYLFRWTINNNICLMDKKNYVCNDNNEKIMIIVTSDNFSKDNTFISELDRCVKEYLDFIQKNSSTATN